MSMLINPHRFVAPLGLLDPYSSGLLVTHGLVRLLAAYAGPLVKVRRSSDNAEQDIGSTLTGALDIAALLTFVGSGNGFVHTLYSQNGGSNLRQTSGNKQPKLVSAGVLESVGGGAPSMLFDGVDDVLTTAASVDFPAVFTHLATFKGAAGGDTHYFSEHSTTSGWDNPGHFCIASNLAGDWDELTVSRTAPNRYQRRTGSDTFGTTAAVASWRGNDTPSLRTVRRNGVNLSVVDANITGVAPSGNVSSLLSYGGRYSGSVFAKGHFHAAAYWGRSLSDSELLGAETALGQAIGVM